jgi:alpha-D-xyloside xylohydrolase
MEAVFPDDPSIRENWRPYTHRPDVGNDPSLPTPSDSFEIDLAADRIFHQHMVGDWLLVAPVVEEGATSRSVILPAGCKWYNWHTGEEYSGGQIIEADAPLEIVPLFVRAGAIIPLVPERYYIDPAAPNNPLTLRVFPGPPSEYVLHEDDGISEEYLDGSFSRTILAQRTLRESEGTPAGQLRTEISVSAREGSYSGAPSERVWEVELPGTSAKPSWDVQGAELLSATARRLSVRARADTSWHCRFNFLG